MDILVSNESQLACFFRSKPYKSYPLLKKKTVNTSAYVIYETQIKQNCLSST